MAEEWLIADDLAPLDWEVDSTKSSAQKTSTSAVSVQFDYSNSQCSDMYGPVRAMEIYYRGEGCQTDENSKPGSIRVFYGPCCKYALAPVARFAKVWSVPLITPGGLTSRFSTSDDYIMLTRFIAPYEKVAEFLSTLLAKYDWWNLSLLFHDNLGPDKIRGYPMCYDIMEAVSKLIDRTSRTNNDEDAASCCVIHREIFNENYYDIYDFDVIMDNIRNSSRGRFPHRVTKSRPRNSSLTSSKIFNGFSQII